MLCYVVLDGTLFFNGALEQLKLFHILQEQLHLLAPGPIAYMDLTFLSGTRFLAAHWFS